MALKKCYECGHPMSTSAPFCPSCGAKAKRRMGCGSALAIILLLFFIVGIANFLAGYSSSNHTSPAARTAVAGNVPAPAEMQENFEAAIEEKYRQLIEFKQAGKSQQALALVRKFEDFKRTDFKDVAAIALELRTTDALARLEKLAQDDFRGKAAIYKELATLHPENTSYPPLAAKADSDARITEEREAARKQAEAKKAQDEKDARIKQATAELKKEVDEVEGITWYRHRLSPESNASKALFAYIGKKGNAVNLRMKITYTADDWLFIKRYTFNIDGSNYPVSLKWGDRKSDNSGGRIWEWVDFPVNSDAYALLARIRDSKRTILRYEGDQYRSDRDITANEKKAIRDILTAYEGLGGDPPR